MDKIVNVKYGDLEMLLNLLSSMAERPDTIWSVRFAIDGGIKIKVNGGTWTPSLGEIEEGY